jgi:hypothetical protein
MEERKSSKHGRNPKIKEDEELIIVPCKTINVSETEM